MIVKIKRFDPTKDSDSHIEEFSVPANKDSKWTVMDALDYIRENLDSSIAYYRHSICDHGICGRCIAQVNGKTVLMCTHVVDADEITLEPMANKKVVRDLVVGE